MAASSSKKKPGAPAGGKAAAASAATRPTGKAGRVSVAQPRPVKPGSNRTQLIIGGIAVALIAAVVVIGLVLNRQQNTIPDDGYGASKNSVATVSDDGAITFAVGSPSKTINVYEDALCPICGEFEGQFSQNIAKKVDEGKVAVKLHMLTFLNPKSASGDYSVRAAAAMLAVASEAGDQPGLALQFHGKLFESGVQPAEGGASDLTNQALADLAKSIGAPESVQKAIVDAKYLDLAVSGDTAGREQLNSAVGRVGTPTVLTAEQSFVDLSDVDWLNNIAG